MKPKSSEAPMPVANSLLQARGLTKSYGSLRVLQGVDLDLQAGESVAIVGASGSGKTTLLSLLAGLERADAGSLFFDGHDLTRFGENQWSQWRGRNAGIVFQEYHLVPSLTALENVTLPLEIAGRAMRDNRPAGVGARAGTATKGGHAGDVRAAKAAKVGSSADLATKESRPAEVGAQVDAAVDAGADAGGAVDGNAAGLGSALHPHSPEGLLHRVGLWERRHHFPHQLSGGEQQRVALARALAAQPKILFADEPTGNLDEATAQNVESLMFALIRETGLTAMVVTHNPDLAKQCDRVLHLHLGRFVQD